MPLSGALEEGSKQEQNLKNVRINVRKGIFRPNVGHDQIVHPAEIILTS
jgi:hypothetical protein